MQAPQELPAQPWRGEKGKKGKKGDEAAWLGGPLAGDACKLPLLAFSVPLHYFLHTTRAPGGHPSGPLCFFSLAQRCRSARPWICFSHERHTSDDGGNREYGVMRRCKRRDGKINGWWFF